MGMGTRGESVETKAVIGNVNPLARLTVYPYTLYTARGRVKGIL